MSRPSRDIDRVFQKFQFKTREGKDKLAWFYHNGQPIIFTKRSHGRRVKGNIEHFIRQQMKLSEADFRGAIQCTVSKDDYVEILKKRGLIESRYRAFSSACSAGIGR